MGSSPVRDLIWVPIIHTAEDLGSIRESVRRLYVERVGPEEWERHLRTVDDLWDGIRKLIDGLDLDYPRVRLYQDGLPVCGKEELIVRDLAASGSANHRILLDLMGRGASLTGTESPELLLREYELAREILGAIEAPGGERGSRDRERRSRELLAARDDFIAARIAETLRPGETGLVFLGMLHSLEGRLPGEIRLRRLLGPARTGDRPPP